MYGFTTACPGCSLSDSASIHIIGNKVSLRDGSANTIPNQSTRKARIC